MPTGQAVRYCTPVSLHQRVGCVSHPVNRPLNMYGLLVLCNNADPKNIAVPAPQGRIPIGYIATYPLCEYQPSFSMNSFMKVSLNAKSLTLG